MLKIIFALLFGALLFADKPALMLLQTYKDQNITGWVMSEKLDGIRAYWDGKQLLTRSGRVIHAPKWFIKDYPPFAIDGELWSKRGDFQNITSIVLDEVPSEGWKQIAHHIFDVPHAKRDLLFRLATLRPYESEIISVIPQITIDSKAHMQRFLEEVEAKGGEGIVVRNPVVAYEPFRTPNALKVKSFYDEECEVVGYKTGSGKYEGALGSLQCKLKDGTTFFIGSGLSDTQRKNPPKIGTIVTFKYKEFTKNGKPRFPIFLRVRNNGSNTPITEQSK